jgi:hypothetical protein
MRWAMSAIASFSQRCLEGFNHISLLSLRPLNHRPLGGRRSSPSFIRPRDDHNAEIVLPEPLPVGQPAGQRRDADAVQFERPRLAASETGSKYRGPKAAPRRPPCSTTARTTSRSVNIPAAVLPESGNILNHKGAYIVGAYQLGRQRRRFRSLDPSQLERFSCARCLRTCISILPQMACSQLPSMSERILESRDIVGASVDPHRLVALARAVVGHTGSAPRRSRDLAAHDAECLRGNSAFVRSGLNRSRRSE